MTFVQNLGASRLTVRRLSKLDVTYVEVKSTGLPARLCCPRILATHNKVEHLASNLDGVADFFSSDNLALARRCIGELLRRLKEETSVGCLHGEPRSEDVQ